MRHDVLERTLAIDRVSISANSRAASGSGRSRYRGLFGAGALLLVLVLGACGQSVEAPHVEAPEIEGPVVEAPEVSEPTPSTHHIRLHVTEAELAVWRERVAKGPYRLEDDAHENSPGDWQRIRERSDVFLGNPSRGRYTAGGLQRDGGGCVASSSRNDPYARGSLDLRHAAFRYLITGETAYRDAVRAELLAQSDESAVDFSNGSLWCNGRIGSGHPNFRMANWMNHFLVAYDYLGPDSFTPSEHEHLRAWFLSAANYLINDVNLSVEQHFSDRYANDYTLTDYSLSSHEAYKNPVVTHYDGWDVGFLARFTYQNRFAAMARYAGIAGILLNDPTLIDDAKRYFREWIIFGVYPDNTPGEFNRWTSSNPDGGLGYAASIIGEYIILADHLARTGDTELYEFTTTLGAFGTQGGPKSLLGILHNFSYYIDGTHKRYATTDPNRVGNTNYLINDYDPVRNQYSVFEVYFLPAARYYDDAQLNDLVYRTGPNMRPYPTRPIGKGYAPVWEGQAGLYPAMHLMYGHTEEHTNPYP